MLLGLSVYSGQPDNTDRCSRPEVSAIRGFHCTTYIQRGGEFLLYDERRCKVENLDKSVHAMNMNIEYA